MNAEYCKTYECWFVCVFSFQLRKVKNCPPRVLSSPAVSSWRSQIANRYRAGSSSRYSITSHSSSSLQGVTKQAVLRMICEVLTPVVFCFFVQDALCKISPVAYVDILDGDTEGHIRFHTPEEAKAISDVRAKLLNEHSWKLEILSGVISHFLISGCNCFIVCELHEGGRKWRRFQA